VNANVMNGDAIIASSVTGTIIDSGVTPFIVVGNSVLAELYSGFLSRFQQGRLRPALFLSRQRFPYKEKRPEKSQLRQ
jgi:hypothetical protein